ncbi:hypothetical protein [Lysinibacillus sp. NPDC093692]|uniref:hypothetical protein n=1 Tax=Lysinibacillus sp. NPDC093692 TaxID=3390578 RepID=UPI003D033640
MKRVIEVILCIFAGVFLFGIIAIAFQVIGEDSPNKASIIGGILSMIGGALGALGAYIVATYQMNKQFEYEKKKEETQRKAVIVQNLKKLELLNNEAIMFIDFFKREYCLQFDEIINIRLNFSEKDLFWIVNTVNNLNDEVLMDGYALDYLKFSRELNNLYIDVSGLNSIPEHRKENTLINLIGSLEPRKKIFVSFDEYVKDQIKILQKELEDIN